MMLPANPFAPATPVLETQEEAPSLIAPQEQEDDRQTDFSLRPSRLQDFIGQDALKANLDVFIAAARQRQEPMEHLLFYGNPGLGKTTLAHIIAGEAGRTLRITSGPALTRVGDLAAVLTNLKAGDVLFIDEIHRMNRAIEEVLYPAMEDFALDLIVGKGPGARTVRLALEKFTLIGATTRVSLLSSPLRDRFGALFHLDFYTEADIAKIVDRSAQMLQMTLDSEARDAVAGRSRRTPRIANRLLKRVRDFAEVRHNGDVTGPIAHEALAALAIDAQGVDSVDRLLLSTLITSFAGGPVGLGTLAAATAEDEDAIETVHEPYLIQLGLLQRTPRGRVATKRAYEYLHLTPPAALL